MASIRAAPAEVVRRHGSGPEIPGSAVELTVIGFIIVVALYFGRAVLVPLALAVILSFVLAPPVRALRRVGVANAPAVFLVVALAFSVIFAIGALITQQVGSLATEIPRYQLTLKDKIKALKEIPAVSGGGAIDRASETLKDLQQELETPQEEPATGPPAAPGPSGEGDDGSTGRPIPVEVHTPQPTPLDRLQSIIGIIIAPLATTGIVILFVLFLLLQRVDVRDRAIRLLGSQDLEKSTTAMDDAGHRLSSYFLALTAINTAYGIAIGCALWAIGVPTPILWGVLAMLMRFVPFIGSFISAAFPLLLAAAVDPGWSMFLWTLALYVVAEPIMGNVIEPVIQGHRTGMSPLAIVLSAAFWTLLWGPIGLLLAIPLTVVLVVLGRHVERFEFLHVLLGDAPPLSPAQRFYQRMLAGDPAEAIEQAEKILKEESLVDYYDGVVIEGLRLAQADCDRGTLEPERQAELHETAEIVIDTLSDSDLLPAKRTDRASSKPVEEDSAAAGSELTAGDEEHDELSAAELSAPRPVPDEWQDENAIICVAGRTALDQTAALILAQLLTKYGLGAKVLEPGQVKHGTLRSLDLGGARLICVSALDVRERGAHTRFLVRRLKRAAPHAVLLGGFWKLDQAKEPDKSVIDSIAVDAAVPSIRAALAFCLETARTGEAEADRSPPENLAASLPA